MTNKSTPSANRRKYKQLALEAELFYEIERVAIDSGIEQLPRKGWVYSFMIHLWENDKSRREQRRKRRTKND